MFKVRLVFICLVAAACFGRSAAPPVLRTGAQIDGGITCNACHRGDAPNADRRGSLQIQTTAYQPGVKQIIRVILEHPDARRWGFQLTARTATNEISAAGTFTATNLIRVLCAPTGTDAPCNGQREFASHTTNSIQLGTNGRSVWEVEWTPPAQDAGDVVFYAAGNAADNSANNTGDLIYTTSAVVRSAAGCTLPGTPTLSGVSNAASGAVNMTMNGLASLYGSNFLPAGRVRLPIEGDVRTLSFPRQMDCVTVLVNGEPVPLTFVSGNQINFQAPLEALNTRSVQVVANRGLTGELRSNTLNVPIALVQPGLFPLGSSNYAAARHPDGVPVAAPSVVAGARPVRPGDFVTLYLTGLGLTQPVWASGDIVRFASPLASRATVTIGGVAVPEADIPYAGAVPQSISGLYQINVRVPASLESADHPVVVTIGGVSSPARQLAVARQ